MYLQMTWPSLFTILQRFVHPTRLTYPGYPNDSEKFVELMEETIKQGSEAKGAEEAIRQQAQHRRSYAPWNA
jgi:hypothetical protein